MFSNLNYLHGQFERVVNDQEVFFGHRLFSLLYSCDIQAIDSGFDLILKDENLGNPWRSRVLCMRLALLFLNKEFKLVRSRINTIQEDALNPDDPNASIYLSLRRVVARLSEEDLNISKWTIGLIGDSHTFSMSTLLTDKSKVRYLPGLQFRLLAANQINQQKQALINAFGALQGEPRILLSLGEIDQRFLYKATNFLHDKYVADIIVKQALTFVRQSAAPWQRIYLADLPRFNSLLLTDSKSSDLVERSVSNFRNSVISECLIQNIQCCEWDSDPSNTFDRAHFLPKSYELMLNDVAAP